MAAPRATPSTSCGVGQGSFPIPRASHWTAGIAAVPRTTPLVPARTLSGRGRVSSTASGISISGAQTLTTTPAATTRSWAPLMCAGATIATHTHSRARWTWPMAEYEASRSPEDGTLKGPDRYAGRDDAISACQRAAEQRIQRDGYRNVQFLLNADNRRDGGIAGTATGQRGNNGRAYDFEVRCSVNPDNGSIRSAASESPVAGPSRRPDAQPGWRATWYAPGPLLLLRFRRVPSASPVESCRTDPCIRLPPTRVRSRQSGTPASP